MTQPIEVQKHVYTADGIITDLAYTFTIVNTDAMKDRLGVPKSEETAPAEEEPGLGLSLEQRWKMVGKDIRAHLALPIGG